MAINNNMSNLLDKIERRLGTKPLNLPDRLKKSAWVNVIDKESLETFSRYFPYAIQVEINKVATKKGKYWLIDEEKIGKGVEILGVRDIDWQEPQHSSMYGSFGTSYGITDWFCQPMCLEDMVALQFAADNTSLFNNGIYLDFEYPNKIVLRSALNYDITNKLQSFFVVLLIKHPISLTTIAPTKMETFEALCKADVASFLYQELKHYDGLETVFANIDIKLDDLRSEADKRDEIIDKLENSYVSFANKNQPMLFTME